jgi:hypothetical protein
MPLRARVNRALAADHRRTCNAGPTLSPRLR